MVQDSAESKRDVADVFRLINSGQLEQAEQRCAELIENRQDDVNILALRGAILLKLRRNPEAETELRKAIDLEPGFAKPHEDLGRLLFGKGDFEQSAQCFRQATELDSSQADAWSGLANALARLGRTDEANAAHRQFLERSPLQRELAEANALVNDGETTRAEEICQQVLRRQPENTAALRMLARIATDDGRFVVAEELLRRILEMSPNDYLPLNELGRYLFERSRFPEAIEMFERAVALDATVPDNYRLLGDALSIIGRSPDALLAYQNALGLDADDPHALAGQGHMLRIMGSKDDAIEAYERCTTVRPGFGDAWWNLASLRGYCLSDQQLAAIREQLDSGSIDADAETGLRFALARAAEERGDFSRAWEEYQRANKLKRSLVSYDPVQTEMSHDAIIEQFTADFLQRGSRAEAPQHAPIFILGMPRSGSTLLEQILASHSMVEGAGELPYIIMLSASLGGQRSDGLKYPEVVADLTEQQFESMGQGYVYHSGVHRSLKRRFFTDKMPANFPHVGFIHMLLPHAKIIDARRHPLDTCVANFRQLFAQGKNQSYDLHEFAEYYLEYIRLMDHWDAVLPGRVLKMQYEDVVRDLETQTRRLLEHCELPWEDACLEFHRNRRPVNTASAEQVRQPIYTDSVDYWKNYNAGLDSIKEILEAVLPG